MTSSVGAVHALNDPIFLYSSSVLFACILTASVRVDDTAFYIRIWFVCVFKSMAAERNSHIIFSSYPQRHQIKLVFFVDLHHFICKCLILPGGVFMAEMIIKCLSCNLQSLAVKTDPTVSRCFLQKFIKLFKLTVFLFKLFDPLVCCLKLASFIACFLNSSSYCFPVPIDDTLLCFYYTLIVLYVSSFIIQDYSKPAERKTNRLKRKDLRNAY